MLSYSVGCSVAKGHDSGWAVMAFDLVGRTGFEPVTSSVSGKRAETGSPTGTAFGTPAETQTALTAETSETTVKLLAEPPLTSFIQAANASSNAGLGWPSEEIVWKAHPASLRQNGIARLPDCVGLRHEPWCCQVDR